MWCLVKDLEHQTETRRHFWKIDGTCSKSGQRPIILEFAQRSIPGKRLQVEECQFATRGIWVRRIQWWYPSQCKINLNWLKFRKCQHEVTNFSDLLRISNLLFSCLLGMYRLLKPSILSKTWRCLMYLNDVAFRALEKYIKITPWLFISSEWIEFSKWCWRYCIITVLEIPNDIWSILVDWRQ